MAAAASACERTAKVRAGRNPEVARATLERVRETALGTGNLLPPMRDALAAHCTIGEICGVLRQEWGEFDRPRNS